MKKDQINLLKLFFLIAALGAGLQLISAKIIFRNKAASQNATLGLPASLNTKTGESFTVPVALNTAGASIRGVDIKIHFDTSRLIVQSISPIANQNTSLKTFAPINSSNNFDAERVINTANTSGNIEFSALTADLISGSITPAFNGTTILANLTFIARQDGQTAIGFDFGLNSTTDSNVVSSDIIPADILNSVSNMTITIGDTQETTPTPTTTSPTLTPTPTQGPTPTIDQTAVYMNFGLKLSSAETTPDIKVRLSVTDLAAELTPAPVPSDTCQQPKSGQFFYKDIILSADPNGTYHPNAGSSYKYGSEDLLITSGGWILLKGVNPARVYSLGIKGPKHRNMIMTDKITLGSGQLNSQNFDWTNRPLEVGDLPDPNRNNLQDCTINSVDISQIVGRIGKTDRNSLDIADVNYDGVVNGNDIAKVVFTLSTKPDDE